MATYIQSFVKSDAKEFKITMDYSKITYKNNEKGYGSVSYDFATYGLYECRKPRSDCVIFEEELPDYKVPEPSASTVTRPGPSRPVRERPRSSSNGTLYTHEFRKSSSTLSDSKHASESRVVIKQDYKVRRVLFLQDIQNLRSMQRCLEGIVDIERRNIKDLMERKIIELHGFLIEGIDFNIDSSESTVQKVPKDYVIHTLGKIKIIQLHERFYITAYTNPGSKIFDFIKNQPVDTSRFLESMKSHFLANMSVSLENKKKQQREHQEKLWTITKDIGEIEFVSRSVQSSSNDHFKGIIDKISSIPAFHKIDFSGTGFTVTTRDLWVDVDDGKVYIGVFQIRLSITDRFKVEYRNIASPKQYDDHPHGTCTGTHYGVIQQALGMLDYYTFVLSVIELLQTVNPREYDLEGLKRGGWPTQKPPKSELHERSNFVNLLNNNVLEALQNRDEDDSDDVLDDD